MKSSVLEYYFPVQIEVIGFMMKSEKYANLSPARLIFQCAVPEIITSVFGAFYTIADGIFVGRYLGQTSLAAVNLLMPIIMIVEALSNMIATGASVNISMLLGKKKQREASAIFTYSVKIIMLFSCIIGILGLLFAKTFVELLAPGVQQKVIYESAGYLKVYALWSPLIPVYFALDNYLRVCGRQNFSMVVGIISQLLNVLLDFLFIVVFRQGVKSAALASCISIATGSVIMLISFAGKRLDVYYVNEKISIHNFLHILVNGASEFFSTISASVMSMIINIFILKYSGTTGVAAFSIVMYVDNVIGMVNFGICDSLQPAISYCYGAGKTERLKIILKKTVLIVAGVAAVAFVFMFWAGPYVASAFIKAGDAELREMSYTAIKIFSFSYLVGWIDMSFSAFFTALDKAGRSLAVSVCGTLLFPILFLFILTKIYGINGVWMTSAAAGCASGILTLLLAKTLRIDRKNVGRSCE